VVPIVFHEEVIGTLFLRTSRAQSSFTEDEIRLCAAIANVSANALHNAFLFERMEDEKARLEKLAITDFLTGAFNIRYFYHRLAEEFSRSRRYGLPLSCLMIDIDHFKKINDQYGHRVGDGVLREFAQFLRKHTRKSDVLARYGGEEFIMLLAQTAAEGAAAKAETVRSAVAKHLFKGLKGGRRLTISIGVATSPHPLIKDEDGLIYFADNALYDAKNSGRNRVAAHKP
jgi:two-component system cell cycle response regulator